MSFSFGGGGGNASGFTFGAASPAQAPAAQAPTPAATPAAAAPVQSLNFSFGQAAPAKPAGGAGFSFGTPGGAANPAAPAPKPAGTGFSFGAATTTAAAPAAGGTGFSFGGQGAPAPAPAPSFQSATTAQPPPPQPQSVAPTQPVAPNAGFGGFGMATPAAAGGFSGLGGATTPAAPQVATPAAPTFTTVPQKAAPAPNLGLAGLLSAPAHVAAQSVATTAVPTAAPTVVPGQGFSLPGTQAPTLSVTPHAAISTAPQITTQPSTGLSLSGVQPAKTTATPGLTMGLSTASATTALKIGTAPLSTSVAPLQMGVSALGTTTAPAAGLGAAAPKFGGLSGLPTTKPPTLGMATGIQVQPSTTAASLTTATSTTDSKPVVGAGTTMNYRQLEEAINKWSVDLEEQEKVFLDQATQVNAWDRVLIENGEKISQLNLDVERVKCDQQRMDQELDFTLAQQRELQELLTPLEGALEQLPPVNYQQHADLEREHTYKLAENIDAQMKRMAEDLKEIIEHVNKSNTAPETRDPVTQIAKILNAHMDTLQWIDQNTTQLQRRVDDVSKVADAQRKDQERSFRLAYD